MPRTTPNRKVDREIIDVLDTPQPTGTDPVPAPVAAPAPAFRLHSVPDRPAAPAQPDTAEQRRIKELEDRLAQELGKKDPEQEYEQPADGERILIHFVADGLTSLGHIWYRGQELEFTVGSQAYRDTCDRNGRTWLSLRDDPEAQERRWGHVKFRSGPWKGASYADAASKARFERLKGAAEYTEDDLAKADSAEARRRRAAPRLPLS